MTQMMVFLFSLIIASVSFAAPPNIKADCKVGGLVLDGSLFGSNWKYDIAQTTLELMAKSVGTTGDFYFEGTTVLKVGTDREIVLTFTKSSLVDDIKMKEVPNLKIASRLQTAESVLIHDGEYIKEGDNVSEMFPEVRLQDYILMNQVIKDAHLDARSSDLSRQIDKQQVKILPKGSVPSYSVSCHLN